MLVLRSFTSQFPCGIITPNVGTMNVTIKNSIHISCVIDDLLGGILKINDGHNLARARVTNYAALVRCLKTHS